MTLASTQPDIDSLIALRDTLQHFQNYCCAAAMGGDEPDIKKQFFAAVNSLPAQEQYEFYTTMMDITFDDVRIKSAHTLGPSGPDMEKIAAHFRFEFNAVFDRLLENGRSAKKMIDVSDNALKEVNRLLGMPDAEEDWLGELNALLDKDEAGITPQDNWLRDLSKFDLQ